MHSPRGWRVPPELRSTLKRPVGRRIDVLRDIGDQASLVTVGDVVSLTAREEGIMPHVSVYDGMTERREMTRFALLVQERGEEIVRVENPAGIITRELLEALENALEKEGRTNIRVDGEEDLAMLALMLISPPGRNLVYGWPGEGMMVLTTDDESRRTAEELWNQLEELE